MAKSKFVKLGEKASMFFDPTSALKVVPGQAIELSNGNKKSKRIIRAIKSGHLDYADSDDREELNVYTLKDLEKAREDKKSSARKNAKAAAAEKKVAKVKEDEPEDDEPEDDGDEAVTKESLLKLKKDVLVEKALEEGSGYGEEELDSMNKSQISDEILELLEEE